MPDADRPRHVHGVVVTTKLGKCLLHCAVGGPGPRPAELRVAPLCQLLATMQDLAGSRRWKMEKYFGQKSYSDDRNSFRRNYDKK